MKKIYSLSLLLLLLFAKLVGAESIPNYIPLKANQNTIVMDNYSLNMAHKVINQIVLPAKKHAVTKSKMLRDISAAFLGTQYKANTLEPLNVNDYSNEKLIVNLQYLDCFTFIDYVEALSRSDDINAFLQNLIQVRYSNNLVDYTKRKHFFTDWVYAAIHNAVDITPNLSQKVIKVRKYLNQKNTKDKFLPALAVTQRDIYYLPSKFVDNQVLEQLKDGDYIGIYTQADGLDVTHVGIFIRENEQAMFRHASSQKDKMQVVDYPLLEYIKNKSGIMVLRSH